MFIPEGGRTSYLGDVLAIVVADDRATARAGGRAGRGRLRRAARRSSTPTPRSASDEDAVWGLDGNVLSRSTYARGGDVEAALAASAHVVHEVFQTQRVEHAFLEPESTLAVPRPDGVPPRLLRRPGGVGRPRPDRLGARRRPPTGSTVELVSNGGAFGGKEDMANQAQTALAACLLQRPVKCTLTREQSLLIHPKRHPIRIEYWAGCDAEGRLTALRARMVGDSGPYASVGMKVLERAAGHAGGPVRRARHRRRVDRRPHQQPGVRRLPGLRRQPGPVRHGGRARPAGRGRSASPAGRSGPATSSTPGTVWGPGQSHGRRLPRRPGVPRRRPPRLRGRRRRGQGRSASGSGSRTPGSATASTRWPRPSSASRTTAPSRSATAGPRWARASHTVALQVAVEELGVDPARIRVIVDTTRELGTGQTTGSRGTLMGAGAVADACRARRAPTAAGPASTTRASTGSTGPTR